MKKIFPLLFILFFAFNADSQTEDELFIKAVFDESFSNSKCYNWLEDLTKNVGHRLSGTPEAQQAVELTESFLKDLQLDKVWLQPCMVPHWERGEKEIVAIIEGRKKFPLSSLALGNSIGTGKKGLKAEVIEVQTLDDVERLGRKNIEGKIVFFNNPMDPKFIRTISAYGKAVDRRVWGPMKASEYGAVAVLTRSLTTNTDDIPHTGVTIYKDQKPIPALAISTVASEFLHKKLQKGKVKVYIRNTSVNLPEEPSFNVIGEITGSTYPEEIILVGGHLDSWDVGDGAHDDGAGCVQSIAVLELFKKLNYKPKRTIRCVLFMNEENGGRGGKAYAKSAAEKNEYHLAALESDLGGFTPRSFACEGTPESMGKYYGHIKKYEKYLLKYGIQIEKGGSGADISPLKSKHGILIGFKPDTQRYFDFHHAHSDKLKAVNKRELEMGLGAIASLIYLIDKYEMK